MEALSRLISNRSAAWCIVAVVIAVGGASFFLARTVEHEDDLLAFLPRDNPEVRVFSDINKKFGGLDVALVGIQAEDVLDARFLRKLQQATRELKDARGLDHVLSLANVIDFTPDPNQGGVVTSLLIDELPASPAQQQELRAKVMSRDLLVGNLISKDSRAVLIYCYLAYGTNPKVMAGRIKQIIRRAFPSGNALYWGGGPFISTYIYETTQQDMSRLTPWAVLAIVGIMFLAFRDVIGSFLALLSTTIGILMSVGLMALLGVRFNVVLGSMPVILFAISSAYGIHVLTRYYTLVEKQGCERAIANTLRSIGPTVLTAGLTTVVGLLSFICMDIQPIRTFGLFTALGILFVLILSLTFIPAVVRLLGLKRRQTGSLMLRTAMVRFPVAARTNRRSVGIAVAGIAVACTVLTMRVDTRMDHSTFFSEGSPPDRAERFLQQHFGGSQFIQVYVTGQMTDPHVLRELRRLADRISLLPHVAAVSHLGQAVSQVNEVMVGQRRIPDTPQQVRLLYAFLSGDPSVAQLVSQDRTQALLHIKVDTIQASELESVLQNLERMVSQETITRYTIVQATSDDAGRVRSRRQELVGWRIRALAYRHGIRLDAGALSQGLGELQRKPPSLDPGEVEREMARFLGSDECAVDLSDGTVGDSRRSAVARALVSLGPSPSSPRLRQALARALGMGPETDLVQDLVLSVQTPLQEAWRAQRAAQGARSLVARARIGVSGEGEGEGFLAGLSTALVDLENPSVMQPAPGGMHGGSLRLQVNGLPVMHRGLSHSVKRNQLKSLVFALVLIVLIMSVLFRSLWTGLMVATPTLFTLLVVYGVMGLLGVRLDIGTSMLASLILGAGVDYGVHLTSAWHALPRDPRRASAARATDWTGPAIWTNAIMVCVGFFVLTLGEARPLQNVGGLTSVAMITAAVATFIIIPVLARKRSYGRGSQVDDALENSEAVEAVVGKASS